MAERESRESSGSGDGGWIWLFLIVIGVAIFSMRNGGGGGLFEGSDIRFCSPSESGTVEEEIRGTPGSGGGGVSRPPPVELPPPPPVSGAGGGSGTVSLNGDRIILEAANARATYESEYVELVAPDSNKARVMITGFTLKNKNNESAAIGSDEFGNSILLAPGERAVISTASSPRGFNFKLNKCSGYLSQTRSYTPFIFGFCPRLTNFPQVRNFSENCQRFIERIPYCTSPNITYDSGLDNECVTFIGEHANYAGCVRDFRANSDFDQKEWRIYLGRTREFWLNFHEDVSLYNRAGFLVTKISY